MGKLSEIRTAGGFGGNNFNDTWRATEAAGEFDPCRLAITSATPSAADSTAVATARRGTS